MSMLGNPSTRLRESPYRLGKLVRGIPYLLRTKIVVEKQKRELEKFFVKIFLRDGALALSTYARSKKVVF